MLAWLGLGTIVVFIVLVMTKKLWAVPALILVPLVFGLIGSLTGAFDADLGEMMISGIVSTAPTAVMLGFALLFFLVMTECGLFEPLIRRILKIVGDDPVKIVMGTAILVLFISLDGDGSTAVFVVFSAMYPIYRAVRINPLIMAVLCAIICPTMNWLPWGGPAARMATALRIDISDVVLPMLPAQLLTFATAFVFAYIMGRRERSRINALKAQEGAVVDEEGEQVITQTRVPTPTKNVWFNLILTLAFIGSMVVELLPLPALAMIAFSIAVTVNWPDVSVQAEKLKPHGWTVVTVVILILAAGAFTGIINESGMVQAMADSLVALLPSGLGGTFSLITSLVSFPLLFILSNDGFYFGIVPILAQTGAAYGIPPEVIAHSVLPGIFLHTLSPLNPPLYLAAALLRKDFGTLWRFAFPWAIGIALASTLAAVITGVVWVA
ncbi:MAG: citrate:proton symporter [Propionibacteriaceae bacterium]|jgi:CitMHS family citrate-Mg2+:H+ or citrate-Ca2+:H+ symporter|nr:citrate:proton symporter [Propionibacteriaceae bacterium]